MKRVIAIFNDNKSKDWVKEDPENRVRFSADEIYNMMSNVHLPMHNSLIDDLLMEFLNHSMNHFYDIALENIELTATIVNTVEEFNAWGKLSPLKVEYSIE